MHVNLVSFIIFFKIEIKRLILYTGKYSPAFYFWPLSPSLLAGKFKTGLLPNFVLANNISYNTIASGWIQDGKIETVCKCRRAYNPVYNNYPVFSLFDNIFCCNDVKMTWISYCYLKLTVIIHNLCPKTTIHLCIEVPYILQCLETYKDNISHNKLPMTQ